ncbi:MAG TPA: hypothetical protein VLA98_12855 [Solirubrobacteraceae bacterium]|nr:hypothetical protein [Solirubrobacteraceae bacterium]
MSLPGRVGRAWRALQPEQRLAAVAAILLLLSMLLPWYQVTTSFSVGGRPATQTVSHSAFGAYSFVEAAIFLVAVAVLVLLFARGERRAFHLPGGDGAVIVAAGLWTMFLVFYRQLDKPDIEQSGAVAGTVGVAWGIFVAFLLGALLAYAGWRIRATHVAEPPADDVTPPAPGIPGRAAGPPERPDHVATRGPAARSTRAGGRRGADGGAPPGPPIEGQLSFDEAHPPPAPGPPAGPTAEAAAADEATTEAPASVAWEDPPTRRARRRDVFERPADPDEPSEFGPPRRRRG